ncbi:MAG: flagellar M-ring protein FliF [Deltaproteobacteria bacterium]|nr:MAG: flagellar M-ring protein FliF [Deltaproteobacteria bacterium]
MSTPDTERERLESKPQLVDQLRALWAKLSPGRRIALVAAVVGTLGAVGYVSCSEPSVRYETLFAGLSPEDAGDIVQRLQAMGVPYQIAAGGRAIEVPAARVHEVRLSLAADGVPRGGGVGFEVFDDQSFGTTSFVEQINYRRALQGELARTISSLDAVASARVHIALGERSVFRDVDNPPSASVALRLNGTLSPAQVRGVVNLVASSVEGLTPDRVVVVDDRGNVLSASADATHLEAQRSIEETLAGRVRSMIEKVVGPGHVSVVVTADMNQERYEKTEERFDKDSPVVRSEAITSERLGDAGTVGGIAGARGNLPGTPAPASAAGPGATRVAETRNYEVSRVVTRTEGPPARVERLHVAVLVDYKPGDGDDAAPVPRDDEELARIAAIAREAAGVDPERGDRIEVHSVPFAPLPEPPEPPPAEANPLPLPPHLLIGAGAGALVLFALAFALLRRRRKRKQQPDVLRLPAPIAAVERAMTAAPDAAGLEPGDGGDAIPALSAPPVFDRVARAARQDAQRAAMVLQAWLRGDEKLVAGGRR